MRVDLALGTAAPAGNEGDLEREAAREADPLSPLLTRLRDTPRLDAAAERRLARRAAAAQRLQRRLVRGTPPVSGAGDAETADRAVARLHRLARLATRLASRGRTDRAARLAASAGLDLDGLRRLGAALERLEGGQAGGGLDAGGRAS